MLASLPEKMNTRVLNTTESSFTTNIDTTSVEIDVTTPTLPPTTTHWVPAKEEEEGFTSPPEFRSEPAKFCAPPPPRDSHSCFKSGNNQARF